MSPTRGFVIRSYAVTVYPHITADGVFRRAVLTALSQMLLLSQWWFYLTTNCTNYTNFLAQTSTVACLALAERSGSNGASGMVCSVLKYHLYSNSK
jgi:hypothetical protein